MMEVSITQKPVHTETSPLMDWFLYDGDLHHERVKRGKPERKS